jgi:hypothetical protein
MQVMSSASEDFLRTMNSAVAEVRGSTSRIDTQQSHGESSTTQLAWAA